MRTALLYVAAGAIIVSLPLSWWLVGRGWRDPKVREGEHHRAKIDRLSGGTGLGSSSISGGNG
ncbi:hypothetical protein [Phreatobacter sp.]|uniref:hypothetical protein n=1 Tax=Phreatobacter sp. TaxID=1966341 RepID=UPI003F730209